MSPGNWLAPPPFGLFLVLLQTRLFANVVRDFACFSLALGMAFQMSGTKIASRNIRRSETQQLLAAFVFNIGAIAFAINALS